MMANLVDLIQVKVSSTISRETIETILNTVITATEEHLEQGGEVYWGEFAEFTFKKAPKSKKKGESELAEDEEVATVRPISPKIKGTISKRITKKKINAEV